MLRLARRQIRPTAFPRTVAPLVGRYHTLHHHFSTAPPLAEPPAPHAQAREGEHKETNAENGGAKARGEGGKGTTTPFWLTKFAALGFGGLTLVGHTYYTLYTEKHRRARILAAFESHPTPDPEHYVDRPDINKKVQTKMNSPTDRYEVIVGNHGTGKSTVVKKIANGLSGGLYVQFEGEEPGDNAKELAKALNWTPPGINWFQVVVNHVFGSTEPEPTPPGKFTLSEIMKEFRDFAQQYKEKHGRHAVIVFDNINILPEKDLIMLQNFAKVACDGSMYKTIFVCSDGVAPRKLASQSAWSRGPSTSVLRIGDLTPEQGVEYLVQNRQLDPQLAAAIMDLYGTRIQKLLDICAELPVDNFDELAENSLEQAWNIFNRKAKEIDRVCVLEIAKRILEQGPLGEEEYYDLCSVEVGDKLLAKNVFSINSRNRYDFAAKLDENAVRCSLARMDSLVSSGSTQK